MKVSNPELRLEIYKSKLSYTDLPRMAQRSLPFPDLYTDTIAEIPTGYAGLVKVHDRAYLPTDYSPLFQPFQLVQNGQVIASAFLDKNGSTSLHGRLTDRLGVLIYNLVENYSRKPNWNGYTYLDEMVAFALEQAIIPVLRFDERKTSNPFAFLTTNTFYAFEKVRKREATVAAHKAKFVEQGIAVDQWSDWTSDQNELDNSPSAIFDELCAAMDLLMSEELNRRDSAVHIPRVEKFKLGKLSPLSSAAIKYGLSIGLSGAAIAVTFGLEPATVNRVKNDVDRSKRV